MWRTDCTGLRPKWGIYRYLGEDRTWQDQLRDEEILFCRFLYQETLERDFKENLRKGQTVRFVYYGGLLSGIYFEVYFRVGDCRLL